MDGAPARLEALLVVLLAQEETLGALVEAAWEEERALVRSDYPAIEAVSARMQALADRLDHLDRSRSAIVTELGAGETLTELATLADHHGMDSFGALQKRLLAQASALRTAQERNARLILSAVRLRERWYGLLAGLAAPTYGAAGRQAMGGGHGLVSKSA
ncbi:MAG: flagellar protein FlgN [Dehalococcoidia bacterium]|nr:flagellar protein FlgN [Dehalococcoidia bacterium]